MRAVFGLLLGLSVLLSSAFVVAIGRPSRHDDQAMAWFLASTGWAALAVDGVLFAAVLGVVAGPLATWGLALFLVAQDVVFGWRLVLALRARR